MLPAEKKDVKKSLAECWSSVRDKVEFAENCKFALFDLILFIAQLRGDLPRV